MLLLASKLIILNFELIITSEHLFNLKVSGLCWFYEVNMKCVYVVCLQANG